MPSPESAPAAFAPALARIARGVLFSLFVLAFVLFVWPTRYQYEHMTVDGNMVLIRIDRMSGEADELIQDDGWVPVQAPADGGSAEPAPAANGGRL